MSVNSLILTLKNSLFWEKTTFVFKFGRGRATPKHPTFLYQGVNQGVARESLNSLSKQTVPDFDQSYHQQGRYMIWQKN